MKAKLNLVTKTSELILRTLVFNLLVLFSNDIEIPDEDNDEEEIIRRQRLRREQLKQVKLNHFLKQSFHAFNFS